MLVKDNATMTDITFLKNFLQISRPLLCFKRFSQMAEYPNITVQPSHSLHLLLYQLEICRIWVSPAPGIYDGLVKSNQLDGTLELLKSLMLWSMT